MHMVRQTPYLQNFLQSRVSVCFKHSSPNSALCTVQYLEDLDNLPWSSTGLQRHLKLHWDGWVMLSHAESMSIQSMSIQSAGWAMAKFRNASAPPRTRKTWTSLRPTMADHGWPWAELMTGVEGIGGIDSYCFAIRRKTSLRLNRRFSLCLHWYSLVFHWLSGRIPLFCHQRSHWMLYLQPLQDSHHVSLWPYASAMHRTQLLRCSWGANHNRHNQCELMTSQSHTGYIHIWRGPSLDFCKTT